MDIDDGAFHTHDAEAAGFPAEGRVIVLATPALVAGRTGARAAEGGGSAFSRRGTLGRKRIRRRRRAGKTAPAARMNGRAGLSNGGFPGGTRPARLWTGPRARS